MSFSLKNKTITILIGHMGDSTGFPKTSWNSVYNPQIEVLLSIKKNSTVVVLEQKFD
jgi:hypothetical protein